MFYEVSSEFCRQKAEIISSLQVKSREAKTSSGAAFLSTRINHPEIKYYNNVMLAPFNVRLSYVETL